MKKLDWFVLRSFFGPLIMTFFIVLFILIMQFLWMYVDDLAGKGLEIIVLMELLMQSSLVFVPTALPLGILLAALMTFGNMGENFELSAIKASGISLQRLMRPLIFLIVLISVGSFFFSNEVVPYSNAKARTLMYDIQKKRPELNIQAGTFYNGVEGFNILIGSKDHISNRLDDITIYDHRDNAGNNIVIKADSGFMNMTTDESGLIFTLYNGNSYNDIIENNVSSAGRKYPFRSEKFLSYSFRIDLNGFDLDRSDNNIFSNHQTMQNLSQLNYFIDSLNKKQIITQNAYTADYKKSKIYTRRNYIPEEEILRINKDSVELIFVVDSVYASLYDSDRTMAINYSQTSAREGLKYFSEKQSSLHRSQKKLNRYKNEWHKKLTLAFACIIFFFIGAPLGAIIRKGGLGMPVVISVLFFVVYYVLTLIGEKIAREGVSGTIIGMWSPSLILVAVGAFLTYKATTDSAILNKETYSIFIKNIGHKLGLKKTVRSNENSGSQ